MTYILGGRCVDGIVLVADSRFTIDAGSDYTYDNKLFGDIAGIILGFSGSRRTFELFRNKIVGYTNNFRAEHNNRGAPLNDFISQVSEILYSLYNNYRSVESGFDVLMAISNHVHPGVSSNLRYFFPDGTFEPVQNYKVIGTGAPYGSIFLKQNWSQALSMRQAAELAYFIIRLIETYGLDLTVGIGTESPQIWFIANNQDDRQASEEERNQMKITIDEKIAQFKEKNLLRIL